MKYVSIENLRKIAHKNVDDMIDCLPCADVVPVVRCRYCTNYSPLTKKVGICKVKLKRSLFRKPNDYCSYGKYAINKFNLL